MTSQLNRFGRQHILTVVLEDYCHVGPVSRFVLPDHWHRFESRVEANTMRTLDLLDAAGARATFFILGWIADHQPQVVAEVARRGHEVAAKGYWHRSIRQMTPEQFRADVRRTKDAIEQAAGVGVRGFRIPRGGFEAADLWALDVLAEEGYAYDSSIRPLGAAFADEPYRRYVHLHQGRNHPIWEVPLSTWRLGRLAVPVSGGNFVRQLPHAFISRALEKIDRQTSEPIVFYFHIWELDPEQPRITAVSHLERIRQYRNLHAMVNRVEYYLGKYRFGTVAEHLRLGPAPAVVVRPRAASESLAPAAESTAGLVVPGGDGPRIPLSVVVPCYNEEAGIGYTANMLRAFKAGMQDRYDVTFVFVDDGSADRTWERLNALFGDRADCQLLRHAANRGVAATVLTGIRHARTEIVGVIDCDGTYDPLQLRAMIPMLAPGVDMVTASPYHPSGEVLNLPARRLVLSKGLSVLYRLVHRNRLYTYTACFRVYRRRAVCDLVLRDERFVGIAEILSKIDAQGGKIVESPAVMEVRLLGSSKMKTLKTIFGHLRHLGRLIFDRLTASFFPQPSRRQGEVS
jgi:polysaccharide deacetylase family protein (PEP-CTERM system associated)